MRSDGGWGEITNKSTQNQKIETLRDTTDTKMETKPRKNEKEGDLSEAGKMLPQRK